MSDKPIIKWIVLFSGFGQDNGQKSGTIAIWRRLYNLHAGPQCCVEVHPWNTSVRALAHKIRNNKNGELPSIIVGGYSFGGMTAVNFANQLRLCGLSVKHMILSDPVYRHSYYAGWWRSMVPWSEIRVPPNVHTVKVFAQANSRYWPPNRAGGWFQPAGHAVVGSLGEEYMPTVLEHDHSNMDDATQYHEALLNASFGVLP